MKPENKQEEVSTPVKKKEYNVKIKPQHREIVKKLPENHWNMSKTIREVGMSESVANKPKDVTNTKSFQMALNEAGLSLDTLNNYLSEDLEKKKQNRFQELQLAYKLHGKLKDTKEGDKTLILITTPESATRYKLDVDSNK